MKYCSCIEEYYTMRKESWNETLIYSVLDFPSTVFNISEARKKELKQHFRSKFILIVKQKSAFIMNRTLVDLIKQINTKITYDELQEIVIPTLVGIS